MRYTVTKKEKSKYFHVKESIKWFLLMDIGMNGKDIDFVCMFTFGIEYNRAWLS